MDLNRLSHTHVASHLPFHYLRLLILPVTAKPDSVRNDIIAMNRLEFYDRTFDRSTASFKGYIFPSADFPSPHRNILHTALSLFATVVTFCGSIVQKVVCLFVIKVTQNVTSWFHVVWRKVRLVRIYVQSSSWLKKWKYCWENQLTIRNNIPAER